MRESRIGSLGGFSHTIEHLFSHPPRDPFRPQLIWLSDLIMAVAQYPVFVRMFIYPVFGWLVYVGINAQPCESSESSYGITCLKSARVLLVATEVELSPRDSTVGSLGQFTSLPKFML